MKTIAGPGFTGTVYAEGGAVFELAAGGRPLLRLGRTRCGGFAEDGALLKKLRFHASLDSLSASIDTASVIPFGCEYLVSRELEMVAGLALWTVDVSAVARGIVSAVELEPVTFPGPWRTLEYLIYGEKEFRRVEPGETETEFYRGRELVMSVRLTAADGARVEFNAGGDLWRHRAAMHLPEAEGEYALSGSADRIVLTRRVFAFGADAVIEKRPWRFRNSFAWSLPGDTFAVPGDEAVLGGGNGVKRRHAKTRGDVRYGGVVELYARLFQRRDERAARFREIHGAVGDAILLGDADRVVRVAAVVLRRGAGQENAHGVAARLLAENTDERAVLAAAVAVNDALAAAFFQQLPDKGNAVFEFLFIVAHNECPPFRECAVL